MSEILIEEQQEIFIEFLIAWHANRLSQIEDLIKGAKEGTTLRIEPKDGGDPKMLTLTKEQAFGLMVGVKACQAMFLKLPFEVHPNNDNEEKECSHD